VRPHARKHTLIALAAAGMTPSTNRPPVQEGKETRIMAGTLSVWKFNNPEGAQIALNRLMEMSKQQLLTLEDAAVVSWPEGKKKPKTHQAISTTGAGAMSGAFWGMLFGLIFFIPFLGMAIGAAMGALSGHFVDVGISDDFIKSVREKVTPGTSALFLMTSNVVVDKVSAALSDMPMELVQTNLSADQEAALREAFGEEHETAPAA
jgi:uncharacterized membrane protein